MRWTAPAKLAIHALRPDVSTCRGPVVGIRTLRVVGVSRIANARTHRRGDYMRFIALALLSFIACSAGLSEAQEPPGRMGRLAYAEGGVSIYQDPEQGWERAYVNSPITSENSVWTEPGARAELRLGGTALRMDGATQL